MRTKGLYVGLLAAALTGPLLAESVDRWTSAIDRGVVEAALAKSKLMECGGLLELHNAVFSKVGPDAWENRIKPDFMRSITYATIRESGNPFPDWREIVAWARAHPEETCRLMRMAAASP